MALLRGDAAFKEMGSGERTRGHESQVPEEDTGSAPSSLSLYFLAARRWSPVLYPGPPHQAQKPQSKMTVG